MKGLICIDYDDDYKNCQDTIRDPIFFYLEDNLLKYLKCWLFVEYAEDELGLFVDIIKNEKLEDYKEEIIKLRIFLDDLEKCKDVIDIQEFIQNHYEGEYRDYKKEIIVFDIPIIYNDDKNLKYIKYNDFAERVKTKFLIQHQNQEIQKEEPKEEPQPKPKRKYVRKNKNI